MGGGCHWCTEGVFVSLAGVARVEQGWIASVPPHATPSEAVVVHYDPAVIALGELLAVHLETHAATVAHALRHKYRSAVYTFGEQDAGPCRSLLAELAVDHLGELQTRVLPFVQFTPSLPEHQDYYRSDPERPFCRRYIAPKLNRLRRERPGLFFGNKQ
ncbi:Peptide methionine sulfoxide reductase MsrA [Neolewinella maritima]|uniref:peptide-methionine (S)-S-oxide reductase n=1 Tax=Neolewinella maritima TaxID=1383882 RepID=A0ABM9AXR2_9BACT|nr:Peptide methionine sulfoxide reductase MsrA [Neolewinella maritima]